MGKRATTFLFLFYLASVALYSVHARSPETISKSEDKDFRVGLTLSGGGAAGLAHIGVLKVFEEEGVPIDMVAGTSMGAIVGALYAMGYTPQEMEKEVLDANWRFLFEEPTLRRHLPMEEKKYDGVFNITFPFEGRKIQLPSGLVSGNYIFHLLARLTSTAHDVTDFSTLPRPFLCIATDLENGQQVILDHGFLPLALRASMSIPSIFDPIEIDGKILVDGGVVNNLPVTETRDMGADYIIAIDASSDLRPAAELRSLPEVLNQTITIGIRGSMEEQRTFADFYLQPDLREFSTLSFGEVEEIIRAGEQAARDQINEIRSMADSLKALRGSYQPPPSIQSSERLNIRTITIEGLEMVPADHVISKLQIEEHSTIHKDELDDGLLRLYGMQRFNRITYRLNWYDQQADLIINVEEQTANLLQAGLFHNSELGPSIIFNVTFRNLVYPASTARMNIRLGHEAMLEGEYFNYIGLEPRLSFQGAAGFRERKIDLYEGRIREANLRTDIFYAEGLFGPLFASVFRTGFGYRIERFNLTESYGQMIVPERWNTLHFLSGEAEFDSRNRSAFTTRGKHTRVRADLSPEFITGDETFGSIQFSSSNYIPVTPAFTIINVLSGGHTFGKNIPLHYLFHRGGHNSFWGYKQDALSGNNYLAARLALQYRFYSHFYLTPGFNIGNTYDKLDFDFLDKTPVWGWGLTIGWNTIFGPLEAVFMGSKDHTLLFEFQLGITF
ncbi:patatin-like phospholipase family protein [Balneolaceae bacterium ANBcel3]|nr:patatin-like phospholipase family protein [Balneolaceae bacterium ANBcel3]